MINSKMIQIKQDLDSLTYDTGIEIKIIPENFDYPNRFTKLSTSQLDMIMMADSSLNREHILIVFLYIASHINCRKNQESNRELNYEQEHPEAFWKSIRNMEKELSMSKNTINQCIDYLTTSTDSKNALLIKKELGYLQPNLKTSPQNIPSIYVLNKPGYEQEIEWAVKKILKTYKD